MKFKIQLGILAVALTAAVVLANDDFLAEKPPYLTPCKHTDPNVNICYAKNFQVLFSEWQDGVPGLKTVGPFDPLNIKRISVNQLENNPVAQLNIDLTDITTRGISTTKVEEASFDWDKLIIRVRYIVPKLVIDSKYAVKGHILNLELNGNGHSTININDVETRFAMRVKRVDKHNLIFFDTGKLRLEIVNIGGFHLQLDNLFNGQKDLEESTSELFNQNWRTIYEVLGPAINDAIQTVMADRLKKIFAYVPSTYFVEAN